MPGLSAGIPRSSSAEAKKLAASIRIANGAVNIWISQPAIPGPVSCAAFSPSTILALASISLSRPTICVISTCAAAPPIALPAPHANPAM